MIKRLIFDLDGTLLCNVNFDIYVNRAFVDVGIEATEEDLRVFQNTLALYEEYEKQYKKDILLEYLRRELNIDLPSDFIDYFLEELYFAVPQQLEDGLIDILDYLKDKYSLVVLTNWFKDSQVERLRNSYLLDYFDDVYGGDEIKKPDKMAYIRACGKYDIKESIMIGDSLVYDYQGANNAGLYSILLDRYNKHKNIISKVDSIKKLKKIL